jgi:FlgD Ig-like domain/FG-GAP-like repeat
MRKVTSLLALALFVVCNVQAQNVDYAWHQPTSTDANRPYLNNHSGARTVQGPFDLDGDGKPEVLVSDYSGGTRVHVLENTGVDTWELVYSTPVLDETTTTANGRVFAAGDMDGDGMGEIIFLSGNRFAEGSPYPFGMFVFEATGDDEFGFAPTAIYDFQPRVPNRWLAEQMHVMDVDGDGLDEVIFGNNGNNDNDEWFVIGVVGDIGSGFETFTEEVRLSSRAGRGDDPVERGGGSPYGSVPADLDGDGNLEIALMSWNGFNFTNIRATGPDTYEIPDETATDVFLHAAPSDQVAFFGCFAGDADGNGDDEVYCPSLQTGAVSVLNYEAGEDALKVTPDNISLELIPGLSALGLAVGDLTGDGQFDLISGGSSYTNQRFTSGASPEWIRISTFTGGDVEDPANYTAPHGVTFPNDTKDSFDHITRDSSGVMTEYLQDGQQGPEFVAKLAFLGDVDNDGLNELAISIQGVDDSLYTYNEVFNPADSTYTRTLVSAIGNTNRVFLRILSGDGTNVAVEDTRVVLPSDYKLSANYPNPFNPSTSFSITLPLDKAVSVRVYDVSGRLVRTIANNRVYTAGTYEFTWDGTSDAGAQVASGTYLYTLEYGNFRQSQTMVLLK